MQDRSHDHLGTSPTTASRRPAALLCSSAVFAFWALGCSVHLEAQATFGSPPPEQLKTDRIDMPSPINQPPDANAQLRSKHRHADQLNFDAANDLRQRQIVDEATKLLILARDLKAQMDRMGAEPLPHKLIREAEIIEIFARDLQKKMTLTIGPS